MLDFVYANRQTVGQLQRVKYRQTVGQLQRVEWGCAVLWCCMQSLGLGSWCVAAGAGRLPYAQWVMDVPLLPCACWVVMAVLFRNFFFFDVFWWSLSKYACRSMAVGAALKRGAAFTMAVATRWCPRCRCVGCCCGGSASRGWSRQDSMRAWLVVAASTPEPRTRCWFECVAE